MLSRFSTSEKSVGAVTVMTNHCGKLWSTVGRQLNVLSWTVYPKHVVGNGSYSMTLLGNALQYWQLIRSASKQEMTFAQRVIFVFGVLL